MVNERKLCQSNNDLNNCKLQQWKVVGKGRSREGICLSQGRKEKHSFLNWCLATWIEWEDVNQVKKCIHYFYFSLPCTMTQNGWKFIVTYGSRGGVIMVRRPWQQMQKMIFNHKQETEQLEVEMGHEPSKPIPSDTFPPTRLHLLKVPQPPQTVPQTRDGGFNTQAYEEHFLFKSPQEGRRTTHTQRRTGQVIDLTEKSNDRMECKKVWKIPVCLRAWGVWFVCDACMNG